MPIPTLQRDIKRLRQSVRSLWVVVIFALILGAGSGTYVALDATTKRDTIAHDVCMKSNQVNAVIVAALKASLTEPDVKANLPQARAYRRVIDELAIPQPCT
jgi:hypothetical protein